ncbi:MULTISPECIES: hypothetical protein [Aeromonas]|uniref:hypothetical protein n=1 Tax=Aeromonas TaxID=642 RepID=UPI000CDE3487|nr:MULTISPECIES: hypothetical protein [Aeromonas]AUZ75557.1 hypothetical protein C2U40_12525 [Aeromonas sp. ASNIH4]POU41165.1 hypothetical protein C3405_04510 [Aeromonas hydrophila]POV90344.1 hypothetical protein C3395_04545 [Aeromonas sp. ASNIH6]
MSIEKSAERLVINDEAYLSGSLSIKVDGIGELVYFNDFEHDKESNTFYQYEDNCSAVVSVLTNHQTVIDRIETPNNKAYTIAEDKLKFNLYF